MTHYDNLLAAAELVDNLDQHEREVSDAYQAGYRDGFTSGEVVGAKQAETELTAMWDAQAQHVHTIASRRAYRDLERIRWDGRREDFGKPRPGDFKGFGADYEPRMTGRQRQEPAA